MIDSKYPLHPGQTQASPLYCTIPLKEHDEMMKKANKADALEIELQQVKKECETLKVMNAELQRENMELKASAK